MNGSEHLASYRNAGSETALAELLRQHTNLVYSVAKRRLSNASLAEEVTQTVFARLARTPPKLKTDGELVAWLHRTTINVAIDVWRSESRRRAREQQAVGMQSTPAEDTRAWEEMAPHLDEALNRLTKDHRQALLLRFFEQKTLRDIGYILGVSEDAAKMRVSRAVDRLRGQFARQGIACASALLAALLVQCAVEAAPDRLLDRLMAIKPAIPVTAGTAGILNALVGVMKSKVILGTTALFIVATTILVLAHRSGDRGPVVESAATQTDPPPSPESSGTDRFVSTPTAVSNNPSPDAGMAARLKFRVIDRESQVGLPGAKIRASYFYAGGVGDGHTTQTDATGSALIPAPDFPAKHSGLNVFASIEGYVPKCVNFHGREVLPADYALALEPALAVGGIVVDEQGRPVPDVKLEAIRARSDPFQNDAPTTDFQTATVITDAGGRWSFPYVPKSYPAIDFFLTCSNYAVTRVSVPVGQSESSNATLVIERGVAVAGRVTDTAGRPLAGAIVKENNAAAAYGERSTTTDADGFFALEGMGVPATHQLRITPMTPEQMRNPPAQMFLGPLVKLEQQINLVAQANGMAPQQQTIRLADPTNYVNFILTNGYTIRGHIVDDTGNPVAEAVVHTDWDFKNQVPPRYQWQATTDSEGRFKWDSAPAEPVFFYFEADDHEIVRDVQLLPDGTDYEIRLPRKARMLKVH